MDNSHTPCTSTTPPNRQNVQSPPTGIPGGVSCVEGTLILRRITEYSRALVLLGHLAVVHGFPVNHPRTAGDVGFDVSQWIRLDETTRAPLYRGSYQCLNRSKETWQSHSRYEFRTIALWPLSWKYDVMQNTCSTI
jgi:hypothetical protein